jgi:hypothetical protein
MLGRMPLTTFKVPFLIIDVLLMVILCDTISMGVAAVTRSFASANSALASSKPGQGFEMRLGWLSTL